MITETKKSFDEIIGALPNEYKVLDIGAAGAPTRRADYIIDLMPYEKINYDQQKGPGEVRFNNKEHYIQHDICKRTPWPFADKFFDYSICSHTLEDLRDPLWVCSEIIRVSKAGYIEVPSRFYESIFGLEAKNFAGNSHHFWITELAEGKIRFTFKNFYAHVPWLNRFAKTHKGNARALKMEWSDSFEYLEYWLISGKQVFEYFLERPVTEKEMWKIYRKTQDKNVISRWLRYLKNTNPFFGQIYMKMGGKNKKNKYRGL